MAECTAELNCCLVGCGEKNVIIRVRIEERPNIVGICNHLVCEYAYAKEEIADAGDYDKISSFVLKWLIVLADQQHENHP
jgi:hypothetical protein